MAYCPVESKGGGAPSFGRHLIYVERHPELQLEERVFRERNEEEYVTLDCPAGNSEAWLLLYRPFFSCIYRMIVALYALQELDRQKILAAPLAEVRSTLPSQNAKNGRKPNSRG